MSDLTVNLNRKGNYELHFTDGWIATMYPNPQEGKIVIEYKDSLPNCTEDRRDGKIERILKARREHATDLFDEPSVEILGVDSFRITADIAPEAFRFPEEKPDENH